MKHLIVLFSLALWTINALAFDNNFFKVDIPEKWITKSDKGIDPSPYELNIFMDKENDSHQFFYAYVSKQIPDPKDVICIHIGRFLDNSGLESLCSYSEEQFHGHKAIKYTFCGKLFGAFGRGTAYSFLDAGYVFLFVNFFVPNVFENRKEYDVWKDFELFHIAPNDIFGEELDQY